MATRSKTRTRATRAQGRSREGYGNSRVGLRGRVRGAMRNAAENGVRVKAEMTEPRVARIVIEIDWEELAARMARRVGRGIKRRVAQRERRTRRASAAR